MADATAVKDQPVAHECPFFTRNEGRQVGLDLDRIFFGGEPHATRQSADVGVNGDARDPERVAENDVRRLAPDSGQLDQELEFAGHFTLVILHEVGTESKQRIGLRPEETQWSKDRLELFAVSRCVSGSGPITIEKDGCGRVYSLIGGLCRKDRCDQEFEWG